MIISAQIQIDPMTDSCRAPCDILSKVRTIEQCGERLWYQVLSVDMSDANSQCPDGWVEENDGGVRACGRGTVGEAGCKSVHLRNNIDYTKVCGRAIGYQYGSPDAFDPSRIAPPNNLIDQTYVDGLSITYGSPRQHIWTYAAGAREGKRRVTTFVGFNCPCSSIAGAPPPSFVGTNFYCESGNPEQLLPRTLYSSDPLWDGEQCEGTCCSKGKSPPWFSVELPHSTNANIEARICLNENSNNENVFIKLFEIYIQ